MEPYDRYIILQATTPRWLFGELFNRCMYKDTKYLGITDETMDKLESKINQWYHDH